MLRRIRTRLSQAASVSSRLRTRNQAEYRNIDPVPGVTKVDQNQLASARMTLQWGISIFDVNILFIVLVLIFLQFLDLTYTMLQRVPQL